MRYSIVTVIIKEANNSVDAERYLTDDLNRLKQSDRDGPGFIKEFYITDVQEAPEQLELAIG